MRAAALFLLALAAACRAPAQGPYSPTPEDRPRDTVRAERLSKEAADLIHSNASRPQQLLALARALLREHRIAAHDQTLPREVIGADLGQV